MARLGRLTAALAVAAALTSCTGTEEPGSITRPRATTQSEQTATTAPRSPVSPTSPETDDATPVPPPAGAGRPVTLGFAGDVHFEDQLVDLLGRPRTALRPIQSALQSPDLMMLNLETAITGRGSPEPKRYHFRTPPTSLEVLEAAGVDVASLANNHAVDYGRLGLRDTLAAVRESPIPVVGVGSNARAAFRPYVASIRGTSIAVLAATTKPDRTAAAWSAGPDRPGVAAAVRPRPQLIRAVRAASQRADVVVVYLHWGREYESCPHPRQMAYAHVVARAGADVVVGSHAHTLLGAGWLGSTYVGYGLGNFVWYNQNSVATGILTLTIRDGQVHADAFTPAHIQPDGRPRLLAARNRAAAVARWRALRDCAGVAPHPSR